MSPASVIQSVLNPVGPQAGAIHGLWTLMLWVTASIYVIVLAAVVVAVRRRTSRQTETRVVQVSMVRSVGAAVGVSALILIGLLVASVWTGRSVASLHASSAVTIAVTGHQWWWEVEYQNATPSQHVRTANEINELRVKRRKMVTGKIKVPPPPGKKGTLAIAPPEFKDHVDDLGSCGPC